MTRRLILAAAALALTARQLHRFAHRGELTWGD